MRNALLVMGAALPVLLSSPAAAEVPPPESTTQGTLTVGAFDRQLTRVPLTFACTTPPPGASACDVVIHAAWSLVDGRTGRHKTTPVEFAALSVSVPAGATKAVDVDTHALGLRTRAAKTVNTEALVDVDVRDAAGGGVDFGSALGYVPPFESDCHQPRSFPFTGGPVQQERLDGKGMETVVSDRLDSTTDTTTGAKGASFSLYGVTYAFGPHARFALLCSALSDYARGKPFPTVFMHSGTVHVTGKPGGFQYVASIFTPEGSLGSRSQEKIDFRVTRKAKAHRSVLEVTTGKTTQITPVNSSTRSPCTNGHALSVDRKGRIAKLG